jgi:hypothetical protein
MIMSNNGYLIDNNTLKLEPLGTKQNIDIDIQLRNKMGVSFKKIIIDCFINSKIAPKRAVKYVYCRQQNHYIKATIKSAVSIL